MADAYPQQNPDNAQIEQLLLVRKSMLEMMNRELQPSPAIAKIEPTFVTSLTTDLSNFVIELKSLRGNANAKQFVKNVGRLHELIRDFALVELLTALRKFEEGDTQEYFQCLFRCSDDLEEALKEFLI